MNILLNAVPLKNLMTGISRYVRNLYQHMETMPGASVYYFGGRLCRKEMPEKIRSDSWVKNTSFLWKLPWPLALSLQTAGWLRYERNLRLCAQQNRFEAYHETAFTPSAIKAIPQVLTIYDLSLLKFKNMHPKERVRFYDIFLKRRLKYAAHIITISDFVRSEVCSELDFPSKKITAIPLAPDPFFSPRETQTARGIVAKMGLPEEFLLFVGTLEPRKNLPLLIKAAAACKSKIPIVLVGWDGWGKDAWKNIAKGKGLENRIFTTGYVDEEALASLYSAAKAFVFPSFYEGFGLPVLEAMACGCPVICSNTSSLPEVAGEAAVFIDPFEPKNLAMAIDKIVENPRLREDLVQKGFEQVSHFSWKKTAEQTLQVFRSVAGQQ